MIYESEAGPFIKMHKNDPTPLRQDHSSSRHNRIKVGRPKNESLKVGGTFADNTNLGICLRDYSSCPCTSDKEGIHPNVLTGRYNQFSQQTVI